MVNITVAPRAGQSSVNELKLLKINETFRQQTKRTVNFQLTDKRNKPFGKKKNWMFKITNEYYKNPDNFINFHA